MAPALLIAGNVLARRSPRWPSVALASLVVAGSLWAQARVGAVVQMIAEPLGRNAMERVTSMAPTAVRYLGQAFLLERPCMVRVVPVRTASDPAGLLSLAILALLPLAAWRRWRAGDRLPRGRALDLRGGPRAGLAGAGPLAEPHGGPISPGRGAGPVPARRLSPAEGVASGASRVAGRGGAHRFGGDDRGARVGVRRPPSGSGATPWCGCLTAPLRPISSR